MIISPVSQKSNVKLIHTISVDHIYRLYSQELEVEVSRMFGDLTSVSIYECLDTGYRFYHPFTIAGDSKLYDDLKISLPKLYNTSYYSAWKWEYDKVLPLIGNDESVLEIGCGAGNFLEKLSQLNSDRRLLGLEFNKESVDEANAKGVKVVEETIEKFAENNDLLFDTVCFFQVLEHISDISSFMNASIKTLKPGGKLIVAVPVNGPYMFRHDIYNTLNLPPHHMGLWSKKAFKNLVKFYPLDLKELIVEGLPRQGYDFNRFYEINKDVFYKVNWPGKGYFDILYRKYLRAFHNFYPGKNIVAVYQKR